MHVLFKADECIVHCKLCEYLVLMLHACHMQCTKQDVEIVYEELIMLYKLQTFWFKEQVPLDSRTPTEVTPLATARIYKSPGPAVFIFCCT